MKSCLFAAGVGSYPPPNRAALVFSKRPAERVPTDVDGFILIQIGVVDEGTATTVPGVSGRETYPIVRISDMSGPPRLRSAASSVIEFPGSGVESGP